MKSLLLFAFIILASHIPAVSFAQGEPQPIPQAITVLKRPQLPGNAQAQTTIDEIVAAEPSKYGKFRLEKTEECEKLVFFDRITPDEQTHALFKLDTCSTYQNTIDELGAVNLPFITPNGEEFHLFLYVYAGSGNVSLIFPVVTINKENIWNSDQIYVHEIYNPQTQQHTSIEEAYIIQKNERTILSLIAPPTTKSNGETFNVSMGSLETKPIDPLPRWAKSTRTFKIVGTFEAETGNDKGGGPCIAGKETSMDADIKAPTGDQEYCIQHMSTCEFPESPDGYGSVPAEMTLLETLWSDSTREYTCLYLKGL
jgi:hypothetical protein